MQEDHAMMLLVDEHTQRYTVSRAWPFVWRISLLHRPATTGKGARFARMAELCIELGGLSFWCASHGRRMEVSVSMGWVVYR